MLLGDTAWLASLPTWAMSRGLGRLQSQAAWLRARTPTEPPSYHEWNIVPPESLAHVPLWSAVREAWSHQLVPEQP